VDALELGHVAAKRLDERREHESPARLDRARDRGFGELSRADLDVRAADAAGDRVLGASLDPKTKRARPFGGASGDALSRQRASSSSFPFASTTRSSSAPPCTSSASPRSITSPAFGEEPSSGGHDHATRARPGADASRSSDKRSTAGTKSAKRPASSTETGAGSFQSFGSSRSSPGFTNQRRAKRTRTVAPRAGAPPSNTSRPA